MNLCAPWPKIAGILNVTPDSFSDGGCHLQTRNAVERGLQMVVEGAHIIDVGGESTRPGAARVSAEEQMKRILPVIDALVAHEVPISVDTTSALVARVCIDRGATMINDISAGKDDPAMFPLAVEREVDICLMHKRGNPAVMQQLTHYDDVVDEVHHYLAMRAQAFLEAGGSAGRLFLDPGIGLPKDSQANLRLIMSMGRLRQLGYQTYLGASRKSFIGAICQVEDPRERLPGSLVVAMEAYRQGVHMLRVHDVAATVQALKMAAALWAHTDNNKL
ncbi:dihydropteroate synthase [Desulfurispirillum indicum S5]|uniref:Dihydropteroate synthase n=1 Tax=Desulfurispirillum indicum (strain ATCC BAA-1389 / DSM 22839 / S5) TaxID=653733 RepID=E6W477_DESIS|nr:dihydropteroate synthase [Desulfurispirillum indicum]ADU67041.1 dihydropteroate synthase [Desulfurispirillum indicum S5]